MTRLSLETVEDRATGTAWAGPNRPQAHPALIIRVMNLDRVVRGARKDLPTDSPARRPLAP
jgi:hypothetical protein